MEKLEVVNGVAEHTGLRRRWSLQMTANPGDEFTSDQTSWLQLKTKWRRIFKCFWTVCVLLIMIVTARGDNYSVFLRFVPWLWNFAF